MARKVKATFEIAEDNNNAGVIFYIGQKKSDWENLTYLEKVKMLNAWAGMYQLFYKFLEE